MGVTHKSGECDKTEWIWIHYLNRNWLQTLLLPLLVQVCPPMVKNYYFYFSPNSGVKACKPSVFKIVKDALFSFVIHLCLVSCLALD